MIADFIRVAAPVASGTFALTRLWDRQRRRRLAVRAGLYKGIDPLTKQVIVRDVLMWDVFGEDGQVNHIALEVVRPWNRLAQLRGKLRRRTPDKDIISPVRLEGPSFRDPLNGRATWFIPPEDFLPYVQAAAMDQKFKMRPIAVIRRGTKTRTIVGKDIRPALAKAHKAA